MEHLTKEEFKEKLELSALMYLLRIVNKPITDKNSTSYIWHYRFVNFLNAMLSNDDIPEGSSLKEIIEFTIDNKSEKLNQYLDYLPGLRLPFGENKDFDALALQNHSWMVLMLNHGNEDYEKSITSDSDYKLTFKEQNCFTFSNKDNHLHIQSNSSNILDYKWTIISVECNNNVIIKNINFDNEADIRYYLTNYEDLAHLQNNDANTMIDILRF